MEGKNYETNIKNVKSMCETLKLKVEDDVLSYIDSLVGNLNEMQDAVVRLKSYSELMAMDIDLETAKNVLNTELLKEAIQRNKMQLSNINDITFKYLFNDKANDYHGQYVIYELMDDTLKTHNDDNILLFQAKCKEDNEVIEVKLSFKDNSFFIISDFLDEKDIEYKLKYFRNSDDVIFYKHFHDGDMYMHVSYEQYI